MPALPVDLPHIQETGACGIGLFRTELQFMVAASFPRSAEQFALYRAVLDAAGDKPVTFRTLDIGGDKVLPFMRNFQEENPALGWRAIRLGLDRPGLLRSQIRALLRAAGGRNLNIMFPMIATVEEFDEAKSLVERELTHLRRHGHKLPERVDVGTMVEVPSLLYQLDELLDRADFLSIGTNDLVQFFYAVDRGNARVADRFDAISAPVLRALKLIAERAQAHGKPVTRLRRACLATARGARAGSDRVSRASRFRRPASARSRPCCCDWTPPKPRLSFCPSSTARSAACRSASDSRSSPRSNSCKSRGVDRYYRVDDAA